MKKLLITLLPALSICAFQTPDGYPTTYPETDAAVETNKDFGQKDEARKDNAMREILYQQQNNGRNIPAGVAIAKASRDKIYQEYINFNLSDERKTRREAYHAEQMLTYMRNVQKCSNGIAAKKGKFPPCYVARRGLNKYEFEQAASIKVERKMKAIYAEHILLPLLNN